METVIVFVVFSIVAAGVFALQKRGNIPSEERWKHAPWIIFALGLCISFLMWMTMKKGGNNLNVRLVTRHPVTFEGLFELGRSVMGENNYNKLINKINEKNPDTGQKKYNFKNPGYTYAAIVDGNDVKIGLYSTNKAADFPDFISDEKTRYKQTPSIYKGVSSFLLIKEGTSDEEGNYEWWNKNQEEINRIKNELDKDKKELLSPTVPVECINPIKFDDKSTKELYNDFLEKIGITLTEEEQKFLDKKIEQFKGGVNYEIAFRADDDDGEALNGYKIALNNKNYNNGEAIYSIEGRVLIGTNTIAKGDNTYFPATGIMNISIMNISKCYIRFRDGVMYTLKDMDIVDILKDLLNNYYIDKEEALNVLTDLGYINPETKEIKDKVDEKLKEFINNIVTSEETSEETNNSNNKTDQKWIDAAAG